MKAKIKQAFSQAATSYDSVAYLQRSVAQDLLTTIAQEKLTGLILDLGCGTGFLSCGLIDAPDKSLQQLIAVDIAEPMLHISRAKVESGSDTLNYVCADAEKLPFAEQSFDGIVSNLALQWCMPLNTALNELHRVLKPNRVLIFSTFGAQTLQELKTAWASVDNQAHVNEFYTAEQLQPLLAQAGFTNIALSNQTYLSRYDSVLSLMRELKQLGAHSVLAQREQVTTRKALQAMLAAYPTAIDNTQIHATFEIITVIARA
ncbi:MAG: malonyl-ACP O-methyltransferase BioC [Methylococcaceae bacterium]